MKKYVVTGSSGFIGRHIKICLSAGDAEVASYSSQSLDLCDLKNSDTLSTRMPNATLIHAAGIPRLRSDAFDIMCQNIAMIETIVRTVDIAAPNHIIFLSSVEVYGAPDSLPIIEETKIAPTTNYGIGKFTSELMLIRCCDMNKIPLTILRLPGIFGHGDNGHGFIGALARSILNGNGFNLTVKRDTLRDYVFAKDLARSMTTLSPPVEGTRIVNFVRGQSLEIEQIVKIMTQTLGECSISYKPSATPAPDLVFDASKLNRLIPDFEFTPIEQAIASYSADCP